MNPVPHFKTTKLRSFPRSNIVVLECGGVEAFYIDRADLAAVEPCEGGWRIHDREDSSIPEDGPLWVFLTEEQRALAEQYLG